jgi:hypothetical protein
MTLSQLLSRYEQYEDAMKLGYETLRGNWNNERISFTTFWRLKPFWIKCPTENERETCFCKT